MKCCRSQWITSCCVVAKCDMNNAKCIKLFLLCTFGQKFCAFNNLECFSEATATAHCFIQLSPCIGKSTSFTSLFVWSVIYTPTVFHCWFTFLVAGCLLVPAVLNAARFSPGQFGWRCVQLPHSPSHPRPFLPGLPASQLSIKSKRRCRCDAHYTRWRATPPRLGNGQNANWSALLPQVSFLHLLINVLDPLEKDPRC